MLITSFLPREAVVAQLSVRDKKQALKQLAAIAAQRCNLSEKDIYTGLMEREELGCTGMGQGVCIPHARFGGLESVLGVFAQLAQPIAFGAADGKPVDLLFLLLTPLSAQTAHLKALAGISRVLRDKPLCESLRDARDAEALYALLTQPSLSSHG